MLEKRKLQFKITQRVNEIKSLFPNECVISKRLIQPHPLIIKARENLKRKKRINYMGFEDVLNPGLNILSISVRKDKVSRALRLFNGFITLIEKLGHQLKVNSRETIITIYGEQYQIRLREKSNRKIMDTSRSWSTSSLVSNGKLSFIVGRFYNKAEWVDSRVPLEQQIPKIIATYEIYSKQVISDRAESRIRQAEKGRLDKIKEREQARLRWENGKIDILLKHASKWKQWNTLNSFIKEVERMSFTKETTTDMNEWLIWAKKVQQSINPIEGDMNKFLYQYDFPQEEN